MLTLYLIITLLSAAVVVLACLVVYYKRKLKDVETLLRKHTFLLSEHIADD